VSTGVELAQLSLLYLAPACLLALLLVCGRYPGERRLVALGARRDPRRRAPRVLPSRCRRLPFRFGMGDGPLLACNLAGRAPPA
jgi:hypothetical protein